MALESGYGRPCEGEDRRWSVCGARGRKAERDGYLGERGGSVMLEAGSVALEAARCTLEIGGLREE